MARNDYHFVTRWSVEGSIEEVSEILGDAEGLPRWWPSVYLEVRVVEKGKEGGVGKVVSLYTKGWLPYTLRWSFKVTESRPPHGYQLEAIGDFVGRGIWTFAQDGSRAIAIYDWKIAANKPLLRWLSFLLKPLFRMNHHWAMRMGEKSLALELARRRAKTEEARAMIPRPPPATPGSFFALLASTITRGS